jgi:4'-phosphopantetheinyl transferase EntD
VCEAGITLCTPSGLALAGTLPHRICIGETLIGDEDAASLTTAERKLLEGVTSSKRRRELIAGRKAGHQALAGLREEADRFEILTDFDGSPRVVGTETPPVLSITHGRRRAVAAAGFFGRLGIDLCDIDQAPRLMKLAEKLFAPEEIHLLSSPWSYAACWAAKEAGLKALRLGILDGGMFGPASTAIKVMSLDPPRLAPTSLSLTFGDVADGPLAVVWER